MVVVVRYVLAGMIMMRSRLLAAMSLEEADLTSAADH